MRSANDLRHRVTIRRSTDVQTDTGDYQTVWQTVSRPFAFVEGLNGRESILGKTLQGVNSYRITIRYRAGILDSDQIELQDGSKLNITSLIDPDGQRRWSVILAESGSARGEGPGQ